MTSTASAVPLDQVELPFLDIHGADWARDPWGTVRALREADPRGGRLARSSRGVEVLAYADYARLMGDRRLDTLHPTHWQEQGAGPLTLDFLANGHLLTFEREKHLRVRRMMNTAFRISRIEEQRAWFAELAHALVDRVVDRGACDVIADVSHRYSIEILCRTIGVPAEDIARFEQATLDMVHLNANPFEPVSAVVEAALRTLWDYSVEIVARGRVEPREDFISGMIAAEASDAGLTEQEQVWAVANLLFAGHDTTRYQLAAAVYGLIASGAWAELAADPSLAPAAVEESIRMFPIVLLTSRVVATDDVVVDGVHMPVGTVLRMNWFAFNRDPERFVEPDRFDLRRDASASVPFGVGLHKCIGHALARADLEVALEVLATRLHEPELVGEIPFQPYTGSIGGPQALPIRFRAR